MGLLGSIGGAISGAANAVKDAGKGTVDTVKDVAEKGVDATKDVASLASPVNPATVKQLASVAGDVAQGKGLDMQRVLQAMEYAMGPGSAMSQLGIAKPGDGYRVMSAALGGGGMVA